MEYISKLLSDIFAMKFDVVIPISGCIIAILIAFVVFAVRYYGYQYKRRKFKELPKESSEFHSLAYLKKHPEIAPEQSAEPEAEVETEAQQDSSEGKEPVK